MSMDFQSQGQGRVSIVDIDIPMGRMVVIILKWMIASIPAIFLMYAVMAIFWLIIVILFGGLAAIGGALAQ